MKQLNVKLALTLAHLSEIAYKNTITSNLEFLGFSLIKYFGNDDDVSGYLAENRRIAVLVFKGTVITEWQTIKEDLQFWHKKDNGVRYADGFHDAYEELKPMFEPLLYNLKKPLYITGHSLGGAIALITALNLPANSFEACYTFGAPRVCNRKGLKLDDNKAIFRIIHENDIVPSLPLMIMGYIGVGQMIFIAANNVIRTGYKAIASRIIAQALPLIKYSLFSLASFIKNHLINNYIEALIIVNYRGEKLK